MSDSQTGTKKGGKPAETPEVDVQQIAQQVLAMQAEARQVLEDAQAAAAKIVAEAKEAALEVSAASPETAHATGIEALAEAIREMQPGSQSITVEAPKYELPPRADEKEEGFAPVTFRSRDRSHLIVRVPRHRNTAPNGEVQTSEGRHYSFEPTGDLVVYNSDVAEFIRGRPGYNRFYFEVGKEPHSNTVMEPVINEIMEARATLDDERLAVLEAKEQASHKRPMILNLLRQAREQVQAGRGALEEVMG